MALTHLEVTSRQPFAGGRIFAEGGAYERIDGVAHFAVDPAHPRNRAIVDLALAARDGEGRVWFDADFTLLRPLRGGARRLLTDIPNRGGKLATVYLNRAERPLAPTVEIDPGDGFLFTRGWTLAWVGWQWDVADHEALMGLRAPAALIDGQEIAGQARIEIAGSVLRADCPLRDETLGPSLNRTYPAADPDDPAAATSVQDVPDGPRTAIPRGRWRFARQDAAGVVRRDEDFVWLEGGFEPGRIYTVVYRTRRCPVVGVGLAAVRDFASFLRHEGDPAANPLAGAVDHAYGFGVSQSGRFLRTLLFHGMNTDEAGRPVFDGVHAHIGGGRRGAGLGRRNGSGARGFGKVYRRWPALRD